jgi:hypothetical protein
VLGLLLLVIAESLVLGLLFHVIVVHMCSRLLLLVLVLQSLVQSGQVFSLNLQTCDWSNKLSLSKYMKYTLGAVVCGCYVVYIYEELDSTFYGPFFAFCSITLEDYANKLFISL